MTTRIQHGYVYFTAGAWHVRYYTNAIIDGQPVRVQKSSLLIRDPKRHLTKSGRQVQDARQKFMAGINGCSAQADALITKFWTETYLPFIRENKKPSTVTGYEQIWGQHLQAHFAGKSLQEYRTHMGSQFLLTLTKTQGLRTLNHIRSLASGVFTHAINLGLLEQNPWHDVKILGKVLQPKTTAHYTLEEAENIISALVDHVDCQLIMALSCFLGLRPGEIAGLKWEDFDSESVHIRRAVVRGIEGTCKTPESVATLPLLAQVRIPLELWRMKCASPGEGKPSKGWVFPTSTGKPVDLGDVMQRKIRPAVKKAGLIWKGIYAGRRGAGTAIIGLTGGNYAAAQELLRHKHMTTTLQFYKKQTESALSDGVKALESALTPKALAAKND
jgi:integrase